MRRIAIVAAAALAGCGGGDTATTEAEVATPPPGATGTTGADQGGIEQSLRAGGFNVVSAPPPKDVPGARLRLTTGVADMIVYITGFGTAAEAAAYAPTVAREAARAPETLIARRVGRTLYVGVAAEGGNAVARPKTLLRVIGAAEGKNAKVIKIGSR